MDGDPRPPVPATRETARGILNNVIFVPLLVIALALYAEAYTDRLMMRSPWFCRLALRDGNAGGSRADPAAAEKALRR